ncbi:MAG: hypothetical protein NW224_22145 [Leptolyngbyaceae cyanobacterium bins.302]|nr:hypothetical protein [Leptolyngbyaceae cyanobacterium bins.302]
MSVARARRSAVVSGGEGESTGGIATVFSLSLEVVGAGGSRVVIPEVRTLAAAATALFACQCEVGKGQL